MTTPEAAPDINDLIAAPPTDLPTWAHHAYLRIRGRHLPDHHWRALYNFGIDLALQRRDMPGLHAMISLAATYHDSVGDQFGCLPYIEDTMQRLDPDPEARTLVLTATREILVGNS